LRRIEPAMFPKMNPREVAERGSANGAKQRMLKINLAKAIFFSSPPSFFFF